MGSIPKKVREGNYQKLVSKLRILEQQHKSNRDEATLQQITTTRRQIDNILSTEIEKKLRFTKQTT